MRVGSYALAAALSLVAVEAHADPIVNITFSGVLDSGSWDGSKLFGASVGSLGGDAYTVVVSYDPYQLTNDSCGNSSRTYCTWGFGNSQEKDAITINGITKTFIGTSGSLALGSGSTSDQFQISINGGGASFLLTLNASTALFGGQSNVNSPTIINTVSGLTLAGSSSEFNGSYSSTNYAQNPLSSVSTSLTSAVVPEPASLAIVGAGLLGLGVVRRRKQPATI